MLEEIYGEKGSQEKGRGHKADFNTGIAAQVVSTKYQPMIRSVLWSNLRTGRGVNNNGMPSPSIYLSNRPTKRILSKLVVVI